MSTRPVARFSRVDQVREGKPYRLKFREDGTAVEYTICCDCSLVHLVEYRPTQSGVTIRVWRDEKQTKRLRKNTKKKVK